MTSPAQDGLTPAQRAFYLESGYVCIPRVYNAEALAGFEARFLEVASGAVQRPENLVVMKDVMVAKGAVLPVDPIRAVNKILSFENDETLFAYALDPGLLALVRALVGPQVQTISTNVFNKPPEVDGRHPLHQDLRYFALRPVDGIVGTWTAISPMTRENGCLAVIPGSHREGLREHGKPEWAYVNRGFHAADDVDRAARVHLEMMPGDTLLIHPLLIHGSGRNRSDGCRRAISAHFAARSCQRPPGTPKRAPVIRALPDLDEYLHE